MVICPVCNKEISRPLHITKSKDEAHKMFHQQQLILAENLFKQGKPLVDIQRDERIILKSTVTDYLYKKYKEELLNLSRQIRNKRISQSMIQEDSGRNKWRKKKQEIFQNGEENIDFIICKICGFKSTHISTHVNKIHKLTAIEYKEMFPGSELFSINIKNALRENLKENNPNNNPEAIKKMKQTKASSKDERIRKAKDQFARGERKTSNNSGRGLNGIRNDLGHNCRSMWEANIARVLKFKKISYEFEPKVFPFYDEKGNLIDSYLPDFYLPQSKVWLEVKGQMDETSKNKLKLMEEHYPNERVFIIEGDTYDKMISFLSYNNIVWERSGRNIKTHPHLFEK